MAPNEISSGELVIASTQGTVSLHDVTNAFGAMSATLTGANISPVDQEQH